MSDCGVCLYSDDDCDGYIEEASVVVLNADQTCCECRKVIPAGMQIERADWYEDFNHEDWEDEEDDKPEARESIYTCLICAEIATAFYCDGRMFACDLWDGLHEVFGELNSSCFDRLATPEAKAELQRRWMEWKGLKA